MKLRFLGALAAALLMRGAVEYMKQLASPDE